MAATTNPNYLCAPLTVPTTVTPLTSLLQQYFANNITGYVFDPVYSTVQITAAKGNAGTIWVGSSDMANAGAANAIGVGSELAAGDGYFESSDGPPCQIDVSPVYVQASAPSNQVLIRARRF